MNKPAVLVKVVAGVRAGQQVLVGAHRHACVAPTCRREYVCEQACDPRALRDSICPECFKDVAMEAP